MRVLVVSWEYPPVVVGGLGRHVHALAAAMAAAGHEVTVLTRHPTGTDATTHPTSIDRRACGWSAWPRTRRCCSSRATCWPGRWR